VAGEAVAEEVADEGDEEDLLVLDDVVEDVGEAPASEGTGVAEATEPAVEDAAEVEALVEDLAEAPAPEPEIEEVADEDAIVLDDLVEESGDDEDDIMELDDLLEEEASEAPTEEGEATEEPGAIEEAVADDVGEVLLEDAAELGVEDIPVELEDAVEEEISPEPEDMMDVALSEEPAPEIPVEEAVAEEAIEDIMDEPEVPVEPVEEPAPQVVAGNVFDTMDTAAPQEADIPTDAELTGIETLEEEDMDDVDSLLDNVEVDVSDVVEDEAEDDEIEMPDIEMNSTFDEVLTEEAMPPDVGHDVSADVDVDELLIEARSEAEASTVAELQGKVALLESRVDDLERRLRDEIAQMVPAEAARIIREEIAALAQELDN